MEVGGIFHINHLDAWQGGFSTGGGPMYRQPRKKEPEEEQPPTEETPGGVTQDESGVVHVDMNA